MPIALITGAARGIGAATAMALADAGWDTILFDRCADDDGVRYPLATHDDLRIVADRTGGTPVVGDVRSVDDLARAVSGVDVLHAAVAAAGVLVGGGAVWTAPAADLTLHMDVNVGGVANLAHVAVPLLEAAPAPRFGRFVSIGSAAASRATPLLGGYAASKAAVVALTRSLAAELAGTGITANVVEPGTTNTALVQPSQDVYGLSEASGLVEQQIDRRLLDPAEVAAGIAWLCSPASSGVNGAVVPVDAGFSAR